MQRYLKQKICFARRKTKKSRCDAVGDFKHFEPKKVFFLFRGKSVFSCFQFSPVVVTHKKEAPLCGDLMNELLGKLVKQ